MNRKIKKEVGKRGMILLVGGGVVGLLNFKKLKGGVQNDF